MNAAKLSDDGDDVDDDDAHLLKETDEQKQWNRHRHFHFFPFFLSFFVSLSLSPHLVAYKLMFC